MEVIVYIIGMFIVTAILYAIPIITACSIIYEWDAFGIGADDVRRYLENKEREELKNGR